MNTMGVPRTGRHRYGFDGATLLVIWTLLLILVPANLVVAPLGAAGSPAELLGLVAGAWWLATLLNRTQTQLMPIDPVRIAATVFFIAILLSYIAAATRPMEAIETSAADRGLLIVVSWLGITVLTSDGILARPRLDSVMRVLVAATGLAALLGVIQFVTDRAFVEELLIPGLSWNGSPTSAFSRNGLARASGTSTHPIEFGVLLTMILPLALHLAFTDARSRVLRWWPVIAIAAAIPVTMSRSTFLGLALVLGILMPTWSKRRRRFAYLWLTVGGLAVYSAVPGLLGTMGRLFTNISGDGSAQSRVDSLDIALHYALQHPLTGRGYATFLPRYRIFDNQYLGLLIEAGVIGVAALILLFITGISVATKIRRTTAVPAEASLAAALTATVAVAAMACAAFDAFGFPQVAGVLFFALGAIAALSRTTRRHIQQEMRSDFIAPSTTPEVGSPP